MYILYADDAGNTGTDYDNEQQPIFSLTGIVVDENRWISLNEAFEAHKKVIMPEHAECEIHATDIFQGQKCPSKCGYSYSWKEISIYWSN
ncbi:DUF3800 domain-containing protein [Thermincola potens]|uniref:DUF3800 domain-containing protein n=1 Tax=Thermincola potens TaxID=863643 RepID=UPI0002F6D40B|nr:DUF3800 domain-containing protein [Thermincola potens]